MGYKKGGQRHKKFIPRHSKQLKARASRASRNKETDSENSLEDDIPQIESSPSKNTSRLPDGWTEHFDRRTSRYYYNNKADGKTLWDKEAFKQGIIPEIKTRSVAK